MSSSLKNTVRFWLLILVQVFGINNLPTLLPFVTPVIDILFILWLPFKMRRKNVMILAFILGLTLDSFTKTYGLHAAPCVLIAYFRPFLINLLISQEGAESNYNEPSIKSMGFTPYFTFVGILTLAHHLLLFFLEALQTGGYFYFIIKTLLSTALSLLLIFLTELLFVRKQRFRTNTV
mgnify:CR=1 FL=1